MTGANRFRFEKIRHRQDFEQADKLERWFNSLLEDHGNNILGFDRETAQVWGKLRVPNHENALDKQIAATALIHDLIIVTRNVSDYRECGVRLLNPFKQTLILDDFR